MQYLNTLTAEVEKLLIENEDYRCDDMKLYYAYIMETLKNEKLFAKVFSKSDYRAECGLATYESISRIRRFVQKANPDVRATEKQIKDKKELEKAYRKYFREHKSE